jgi:hypothetical protein
MDPLATVRRPQRAGAGRADRRLRQPPARERVMVARDPLAAVPDRRHRPLLAHHAPHRPRAGLAAAVPRPRLGHERTGPRGRPAGLAKEHARGFRRARSHGRFAPPRIHFIPYSRTYSAPLFLGTTMRPNPRRSTSGRSTGSWRTTPAPTTRPCSSRPRRCSASPWQGSSCC